MKKSTRCRCFSSTRACRTAWLVLLLSLPYFGLAQTSNRVISPTALPPSSLCSPAYGQKSAATYVAANHLSGSFTASDIGTTGVTVVIDAGFWYGGTVVFSGAYHVRGNVRFVNGTFELRPGTVFYVEGLSGQFYPGTTNPIPTSIDVERAHLELVGAVLLSTCPRAWGGTGCSNTAASRPAPIRPLPHRRVVAPSAMRLLG